MKRTNSDVRKKEKRNESHMNKTIRYAARLAIGAALLFGSTAAIADDLTHDARAALHQLVANDHAAANVYGNALAVLVFPDVKKAGFVVGAQSGKGVLFIHGKPSGTYRTSAASYGLQAGVQKFGYALFFMDHRALKWISDTHGWEIGTGPSVVIVDKGKARTMSTNTLHSGIYAFIFNQQGLMAGMGLQGSKIKRTDE
jgi:lipid-binding SYLF domain-containing protein